MVPGNEHHSPDLVSHLHAELGRRRSAADPKPLTQTIDGEDGGLFLQPLTHSAAAQVESSAVIEDL